MLCQKGDNFKLLIQGTSRSARTRGLSSKVERRGAACPQPTVRFRPERTYSQRRSGEVEGSAADVQPVRDTVD